MSIILIFVSLGILLSIVYWSLRTGIVPMPSTQKQSRCLMEIIPAEITGTIYELGSGWGTLAISLARKFPGCRVIAYENSPLPYLFSKCRDFFLRLPNLQLQWADFHKVSLQEATLIVCYLFPGGMKRLKSKLETDLLAGTWVVSNAFAVPGWTPVRILEVGDLYRTNIYLYRV